MKVLVIVRGRRSRSSSRTRRSYSRSSVHILAVALVEAVSRGKGSRHRCCRVK